MSNNVHAFLYVVDISYHDSVWHLFLFSFILPPLEASCFVWCNHILYSNNLAVF
jgi:hypothetical protein